jgi:hypothetical protein
MFRPAASLIIAPFQMTQATVIANYQNPNFLTA